MISPALQRRLQRLLNLLTLLVGPIGALFVFFSTTSMTGNNPTITHCDLFNLVFIGISTSKAEFQRTYIALTASLQRKLQLLTTLTDALNGAAHAQESIELTITEVRNHFRCQVRRVAESFFD